MPTAWQFAEAIRASKRLGEQPVILSRILFLLRPRTASLGAFSLRCAFVIFFARARSPGLTASIVLRTESGQAAREISDWYACKSRSKMVGKNSKVIPFMGEHECFNSVPLRFKRDRSR